MTRHFLVWRSGHFIWLALLLAACAVGIAPAEEPLRVHEWGTFTALQDDTGRAIPGINIDDEPLPSFVHNLAPFVLHQAHLLAEPPLMKGAPVAHPGVTMRLETPVLYFHPPSSYRQPFDIRVEVSIRGGWLTEFYPNAEAEVPGLKERDFAFGKLTPDTIGKLTWQRVTVGISSPGPTTQSHVWTTPRQVRSARLSVAGEPEQFLFYRGVGNLDVPLRVESDLAADKLSVCAQCIRALPAGQAAQAPALWLVHVQSDGSTAYRTLPPLVLSADDTQPLVRVQRSFKAADHAPANQKKLRAEMHAALVANGLFADEADAMLDTWRRAYFQSPGLRLFFVVPRVWTDYILPLTLSRPAEIERVMIGRIELISPEQRTLLKKLATLPVSDRHWVFDAAKSPNAKKFFAGRSDFGDLGVKIPDDYQTYLDLGRFRTALLHHEAWVTHSPKLMEFLGAYSGLGGLRNLARE